MLNRLRPKGAELIVGLIVAIAGALVGGVLALAGTYWQSQQSEQQVHWEAVEGYINDYSAAFVGIEYFGNKRVPVAALATEEKASLRREVSGVYAACSRLVLVVPDLSAPAVAARDVLIEWEKAITGREAYGSNRQAEFVKDFNLAMNQFVSHAKSDLRLP